MKNAHILKPLALFAVGLIYSAAIGFAAFSIASSSRPIDCTGEFLFPSISKTNTEIPEYLTVFKYIDGIPHYDYGGTRGLQANPFQVALVATLQLQKYCETRSEDTLRHALLLRAWLLTNLRETVPNVARIEYDFPNEPYAPNSGWGSAFAQSTLLNFVLRTQPYFSIEDQRTIWTAVNALLTPIENGGLHSRYSESTIFWEEVAAQKPSQVVNGHVIAAWTIDEVIARLPFWFFQSGNLSQLNHQAKLLLPEIATQVQYSDTHILYDLSSEKPNLRDRNTYPWRVMISGYEWLIAEGYPLDSALEQLLSLDAPK